MAGIPGVKILDIEIDANASQIGAVEVLKHVRPDWPIADVVFKVGTIMDVVYVRDRPIFAHIPYIPFCPKIVGRRSFGPNKTGPH